ncbi:hypothetical protein [Ottowia sp.]|uniref:hypothetical protein n=1 Tax=Ottowia sp. TaxID=1898956 RepID=UPI00262A8B43|nr:hypothetical protein [Ottowia sp.]
MIEIALYTLSALIVVWCLIVGTCVLLMPIYFWLRRREYLAEIDAEYEIELHQTQAPGKAMGRTCLK